MAAAPPGEDEAATVRWIRAAQKALLRSYRLRCVDGSDEFVIYSGAGRQGGSGLIARVAAS